MKRITSIVLVILITLGAAFSLASCKRDDGVPEGMQLVRGGAEYGYNFYAPEEWTVSNRGQIACVYVSKLDATSVTLVEAEPPTGDEGKTQGEITTEYFEADIALLPFVITGTGAWGEATSLGNSTSAYKYTYTYEYDGAPVGVMQILAYYGERFYILTYTSSGSEKSEGVSYYDSYLEKLATIMSSFEFIEKRGELAATEHERDSDGHLLVSDKSISGFKMYVPDAYRVDYSSGIVSVTREDGTNISMSKATYTGVDKDTYWTTRKADLEPIVDKRLDSEGNEVTTLREVEGGISVEVELDDVKWAYSYEYTYELEGVAYHVYQVLIVKGMNGYVFTYTAEEGNYVTHLDEAKLVLSKIGY